MNGTQPGATQQNAENETAKRAADLFARIGILKPKRNAEDVFRDAIESGATTKEEFAKAYEVAGIDPERATAIGAAIDAHLRIAALETAVEIPKSLTEVEEPADKTQAQPARSHPMNTKATIAREWLVFLPLFALGGAAAFFSRYYPHGYGYNFGGWDGFWNDLFGFHPRRSSSGAPHAWFVWFIPYLAVMLARSVYGAMKALTRS